MNFISIEDDYLTKNQFSQLKMMFLDNPDFPWFYSDYKSSPYDLPNNPHNFQLTHIFYNNETVNSLFFNDLGELLSKIAPRKIIRIKANLTFSTPEIFYYGMHTDLPLCSTNKNAKTSLLYINTNDGYTVFEDNTKISSVENRFVSFNYEKKHSASSTTDKLRVVLNINYF